MSFHPYLFFGGNCREAFTRYQEVFGGELALVTVADMPPEEQMPGAAPDAIMHAAITTADGALLMGSDDPTSDSVTVQGIQVNVTVSGVDEVTRIFEALAEGGQVNAPLEPTSFAAAFGMCTDRFGIPWLLTTDEAPEPAA
jgi:PhnB protein